MTLLFYFLLGATISFLGEKYNWSMIKRITISILLIILFSFFTLVYAATSVGTLNLSGTIPQQVDLSITGVNNTSLDLNTTQSNLIVANILVNSNSGYTLSIQSNQLGTSSNTAELRRIGGTEKIVYSAKLFDSSLTQTTITFNTSPIITKSESAVYSDDYNLRVSYTGVVPSTMVQGNYSDILTLTLTGI